jgi:hypothetical protein
MSVSPKLHNIDPNSARLYGIVAREARRAIVFRRGPSRRVCLLLWNLKDDTLEAGQWFKGRIYERRCDLTPAGDKLVYFAASFRQPLYSWTAVSTPPYLTALALWPKGDCWGGGGLFDGPWDLHLNHGAGAKLADGLRLPRNLTVEPLGEHSGRGEDEPIMATRCLRDGWVQVSNGSKKIAYHGRGARFLWTYDPPLTLQKRVSQGLHGELVLRTHLHTMHEAHGRWYVETADLAVPEVGAVFNFGRVDWADVDHNGDVLYAKEGCLYRLRKPRPPNGAGRYDPRLIADLNNMVFSAVPAPTEALRWSTSRQRREKRQRRQLRP